MWRPPPRLPASRPACVSPVLRQLPRPGVRGPALPRCPRACVQVAPASPFPVAPKLEHRRSAVAPKSSGGVLPECSPGEQAGAWASAGGAPALRPGGQDAREERALHPGSRQEGQGHPSQPRQGHGHGAGQVPGEDGEGAEPVGEDTTGRRGPGRRPFAASKGWLRRFRSRFGLRSAKGAGEAGTGREQPAARFRQSGKSRLGIKDALQSRPSVVVRAAGEG